MGSGNSRLGSSPPPSPRTTKVNRTKQRLASFICGASSSSSSTSQREDCALESLVNSAEKLPSLANESMVASNGGSEFTSQSSPRSEPGASSESSTTSSELAFLEDDPRIESSDKRKCFSGNDEVVSPPTNAESKFQQQRLGDTVSAPCTGQVCPAGVNPNRHAANDNDGFVNNDVPQTRTEIMSLTPSIVQHEHLERLPAFFEEVNEAMGSQNSDSGPVPDASDSVIASQSHGNEAMQEVLPSPVLGLLVSDRLQALSEGNVLHLDVVSISSNTLPSINNEVSTREARRNSRRTFWDAFSSRSSRRHADFPAILFTSEDTDLMGSRRRWLLDVGDDFVDDRFGVDSSHFGRRSRAINERRRNSRSEFWDRLRGASSEGNHRSSCPFDLHPDGSCSCELDEEASALTSISRIVLLAEALFEVLDEIHRQPESFSLSMLSVPAPESVVDSLPIKTYGKPCTANCGEDADQCYICLVEYEEGDKIRVLPCNHEYHMSCVDKWLKEVHGICPLCRGDVRGGGVREGNAASTSVANLT